MGEVLQPIPKILHGLGSSKQGGALWGGRRGGRIVRGQSSGSTMPVPASGSRDSIPPSVGDASDQRGTKLLQESQGEPSKSTASGSVQRSVVGLQNRRTSKGPMKLVIIADGHYLCGLKVIVGSTWKAST